MRVRFLKFKYYNRKKCIFFTEERGNVLSKAEKMKMYLNFSRSVDLPFIDLDVNTICNLKCERCAKNIPYYRKPRHFQAQKVIKDLEDLLKIVDNIYALSIIGGEPFLNKDIGDVISYCSSCGKIHDIDITTNATVMPEEHIFRILQKSRVIVYISDYSLHNEKLNAVKKQFIEKLDLYKISYEYFRQGPWLDFGAIEEHKYTEKEKKVMFYQCPMHGCSIYNDRVLYRCGKSSYLATQEGKIPDDNCIRIDDVKNKREMRKKIRKFFSLNYVEACNYCSNKPQNIQPGVQIGDE